MTLPSATIPAEIGAAFDPRTGEAAARVQWHRTPQRTNQERLAAAIGALPRHADIDVSQPEVAIGILQSRFKAARMPRASRNSLRARLKKKSEDLDKARRQMGESNGIAAMVAAEEVTDKNGC